jgi:hypothetical protein
VIKNVFLEVPYFFSPLFLGELCSVVEIVTHVTQGLLIRFSFATSGAKEKQIFNPCVT